MSWTIDKSAELYGINTWGTSYFGINQNGNIEVTPKGKAGPRLDLFNLVKDLCERGIRPPILIRFPDIVESRIQLIASCFEKAAKEHNYQGLFRGVYPIKVNQQSRLVKEIVAFGKNTKLGLECGSKPELLVALALMDTPDALIICNGFKDWEYIETALLSRKMGRDTIIVVDRRTELDTIVAVSKHLGIKPKIGLRGKLNTQGSGRWVESSGAKSKFGLTPSEIVACVEKLKQEGMIDSLALLHYHIGSQIPSIQAIKGTMKEGARLYTELYALGATPSYIDVGGGLGVDYDGTGRSESSTDYSEQEYANDIVSILQSVCDEKGVPHPHIVTESGRASVAHSALLVFNVLGLNELSKKELTVERNPQDCRLVKELFDIYNNLTPKNFNESYNDLVEKKRDTLQLFTYGVLTLEQRAKAEDICWSITTKMAGMAKEIGEDSVFWDLEKELSDTFYCNFSVFQSLPDSWALNQIFPVVPIHRLAEKPDRRAILVDLTCDSDGKISKFTDTTTGEIQNYLEVHTLKEHETYYLGAFLCGAYQEILGDLHNLFGDTDAVHVSVNDNGWSLDHVVEGDTVSEVLSYVEYQRGELMESIRRGVETAISETRLTPQEAKQLLKNFEVGLSGYTYLEDPE
ncbi:MAG: biosynthetic arginine decarboxylase [Bdellovibrionales bacterium]|nr:biosynthetic arginine decarboxylase [Bdellovibrionales bacterium]